MNNQKGFSVLEVIVLAAIILAIGGGVYYWQTNKSSNQTACTMEAKICPNGTAVGRTGPSCEFAECPNSFEKYFPLIGLTREQLIATLGEQPNPIDEGGLEFIKANIRVWFDQKEHKTVEQVLIWDKTVSYKGLGIGNNISEFKKIFGQPTIEDVNSAYANFDYKGLILNVYYKPETGETTGAYVLSVWY
ncbi:MAG: hypothetical protein PHP03_00255 [Candidatus Pacebacteria bacterium]|nr:hypothetical protein [Candidatus Paceibacterota bacterium]